MPSYYFRVGFLGERLKILGTPDVHICTRVVRVHHEAQTAIVMEVKPDVEIKVCTLG